MKQNEKKMKQNETKWNEMKQNETKWNKVKQQNETKWNKMKQSETKWNNKVKRNETKWNKVKQSDTKWNKMKQQAVAELCQAKQKLRLVLLFFGSSFVSLILIYLVWDILSGRFFLKLFW